MVRTRARLRRRMWRAQRHRADRERGQAFADVDRPRREVRCARQRPLRRRCLRRPAGVPRRVHQQSQSRANPGRAGLRDADRRRQGDDRRDGTPVSAAVPRRAACVEPRVASPVARYDASATRSSATGSRRGRFPLRCWTASSMRTRLPEVADVVASAARDCSLEIGAGTGYFTWPRDLTSPSRDGKRVVAFSQ